MQNFLEDSLLSAKEFEKITCGYEQEINSVEDELVDISNAPLINSVSSIELSSDFDCMPFF